MKRNLSDTVTGTARRDPYFGGLLADRAVAELHADAAARRLIKQQHRLQPRSDLRSAVASGLRRAADRLAPALPERQAAADPAARSMATV